MPLVQLRRVLGGVGTSRQVHYCALAAHMADVGIKPVAIPLTL